MRKAAASLALAGALATVLLLVAFPATSATNSGIVNGSFQNCAATGWSFDIAPNADGGVAAGGYDNNCAGYISTGSAAIDADTFIYHDPFWATEGTKITVYASFGSDCGGANGGGYDEATVTLDDEEQDVGCSTGWELHSWTTGYTGWHYFSGDVDNEPDAIISSTLWVDVLKASGLHKV